MRALDDDLKRLAVKAGLDDPLMGYLQARKTLSVGLMASIATDFAELDKTLFEPLQTGLEVNGKKHQVAIEEAPVAKAALRYLWKLCQAEIAPQPAPNSTAPAASGTPGTAAASTKQSVKEISPEKMRELIEHYEGQTIHGQRRVFPQRALFPHLVGDSEQGLPAARLA